jgi:hypothetical protein
MEQTTDSVSVVSELCASTSAKRHEASRRWVCGSCGKVRSSFPQIRRLHQAASSSFLSAFIVLETLIESCQSRPQAQRRNYELTCREKALEDAALPRGNARFNQF